MNTAIIGLGSNIEPEKNIDEAVKLIASSVTVIKLSELIWTAPIGIADQPDFLNGAVRITTNLTENDLRILLKKTEDIMGRDRSLPRFGPRIIDLDLVVWNGNIVDSDYYSRDFMQKTVTEIW